MAHAVAALKGVQLSLYGLPTGIPYGGSVLNIEVEAVGIQGTVVITVTGDPAQPGVPEEGIAACGAGGQGEEVLISQVIDPGKGSAGGGSHIPAASHQSVRIA